MKYILIIFSVLFLLSCSKQKTVLICGDHVCVNKNEAKQFFEENLSLEVRIIDQDKKDVSIDLVELNLSNNPTRKISINKKNETKKKVRILSNKETKKIKAEVKKKVKLDKEKQKKVIFNRAKKISKKNFENSNDLKKNEISKKSSSKTEITDVCLILEKCNINEISKYLIERGNKKKFPDITIRQ